ncbi:hypothetical protein [Sphingomonas oligophenolica]|uniref:hypothetical protein n=1 Tax=Sphingomonas oligophenolica TaxID=301154 RepID=UPI0019D57C1C|nr:hypothetical protein [Sphingomonas oligophenolica]
MITVTRELDDPRGNEREDAVAVQIEDCMCLGPAFLIGRHGAGKGRPPTAKFILRGIITLFSWN